MSPSEFDLRAALREGEGDGVDAGPLIAKGNRIRRDRRRRINNVIGVAAVVGVLGTAGTFLATRSTNDEAGGGAALSASRPPANGGRADLGTAAVPVPGGGAGYSANASTAPSMGGTRKIPRTCPATPVHTKRPGSLSASNDTLFPADAASIVACAYPAGGTTVNGALITGTAAQSFARSLESAPSRQIVRHGRCFAPFDGSGTVQLRVYDSGGDMVAPLTVAPDCNQARVTNGTVTKYAAQLPPPLPALLRSVR